jgi:type IV secretory pathway VirB10-like protein
MIEVQIKWPNFFLKDARPFTSKRDVNWFKVKILFTVFLVIAVLLIMLIPSTPVQTTFHEGKESSGLTESQGQDGEATLETLQQLQESRVNIRNVHSSLDHLYRHDQSSNSASGSSSPDRNSGMILARGDANARDQLSPGTRIPLQLTQKLVVAEQPVSVIGIVAKDIPSDAGVAIPAGAKMLGEASFDPSSDRASISWRSVILPDGRERPLSAVGVSKDGQVGISGPVHSKGLRNAVGQTLTRFVGAYAAGSINTGAFGANQGGNTNGLRSAIAQTASERATAMGESLQKEQKWLELKAGSQCLAVLNQPFVFRDPGSMHAF